MVITIFYVVMLVNSLTLFSEFMILRCNNAKRLVLLEVLLTRDPVLEERFRPYENNVMVYNTITGGDAHYNGI